MQSRRKGNLYALPLSSCTITPKKHLQAMGSLECLSSIRWSHKGNKLKVNLDKHRRMGIWLRQHQTLLSLRKYRCFPSIDMTHNFLKVRSSSLLSQFSPHAKVWCNYARSHLDVSFPAYLEVNISVALETSGIIEALWIFSHYFILTDNLKHHIIQRTVNFLDALWLQMHCSLAQ